MSTETENQARNDRKAETGVVRSTKMDKTIVVEVVTKRRHPSYEKFVTSRTRYHVHDEKNEAKVGDLVEIMATRPMSKTKRWRMVNVVKRLEG